MNARAAALEALVATVGGGRFLDDALDVATATLTDPRDRALARELSYGVCRHWFRLTAIRDALLDRALKARDADLGIVLALGLYQLEHSRVAAHAAVAETVGLCTALGKGWARGLVNAVLRRFQREREPCLARVDADPVARHAHPRWLLDALRRDWPGHWQQIVDANNTRAPMTLRVNRHRCPRDEAMARLAAAGIACRPTQFSDDGLVLGQACDVTTLPGFRDGTLSVQDEAAQLAAALLEARPGERFLDACSAPGGKLAHILERTPGLAATVALERDRVRTARTHDTLQRLGLDVTLVTADARDTEQWWDGQPFHCILLDAPCSATGVIRRHPDIRIHRTPGDVQALAGIQLELLDALWPTLARGGRLLYATCSIMPEENGAVVSRFTRAQPDAAVVEPQVTWGVAARPGRQILPGEAGMDGFYYALLVKR